MDEHCPGRPSTVQVLDQSGAFMYSVVLSINSAGAGSYGRQRPTLLYIEHSSRLPPPVPSNVLFVYDSLLSRAIQERLLVRLN